MTDIPKLRKEHFSKLLNSSVSLTPGDGEPDSPIDEDGAYLLLRYNEEIRKAINRLKQQSGGGRWI